MSLLNVGGVEVQLMLQMPVKQMQLYALVVTWKVTGEQIVLED